MNRISVLNESKFERMTKSEMNSAKGGICINCKRRVKGAPIEFKIKLKVDRDGNVSGNGAFVMPL